MSAGRRRAPLLAFGLVALVAGLWGGLVRLGLALPATSGDPAAMHGPLMALGFLGTLISLERAVALGRAWAYAAPLAAGIGALAALAQAPAQLGPALLTAAGLILVAASVALQRIQPSAHNAIMGLGAVSWAVAGIAWLGGSQVTVFAPLLAGFLVLTIVGERLELSRTTRRPRSSGPLLAAAVALLAIGLALSLSFHDAGTRIAGVGLLAQAAWLARFDVARRTVRMRGLTRYMACALLAGYVWLGVAGVLWALGGAASGGFAHDASLHAIFLGFVMSMVFAHAPVIVPAVLRVAVPYRRRFAVHLALLHGSLALRLIGGAALGDAALWRWGGVLNEAAIVLFVVSTAAAVAAGARRRTRAAPPRLIANRREAT